MKKDTKRSRTVKMFESERIHTIVIIDAKRGPINKINGALQSMTKSLLNAEKNLVLCNHFKNIFRGSEPKPRIDKEVRKGLIAALDSTIIHAPKNWVGLQKS